ncbi:zinc finger MYND domain-containing protein, putative [Eimeria praecox]|uniref:Zinc finger MYND domain-containing protein, putative n=1 Tax=Eimeria praecox TaxID=51316 RepID=U6G899_9EIME|nr:zinc finger MYND domain-containing protein, putative [Eimeria praecox]
MVMLLRMVSDVRKASGGRGPNLTQRLVLRLLLNGHSIDEFSGGHSAAAAASQGAETEGVSAASGALSARSHCECSSKEHCPGSSGLSDHLNACEASAALLEGLLRSAEAQEGGLLSLGLPALPRPGEIAMLLDRLSANVHSITNSGVSGAKGVSGDPPSNACPCCDLGKEVAVGLYGQPLCRFNHSCFPNAAVVFGGPQGPLEIAVVASRSIMCGEEVCISYVSPAALRQERRNKLYLAYAFTCTCVLCCSCGDSTRSSSTAIDHEDSSCTGNSRSNKSKTTRRHPPCSISFSPAEAFDLQLCGIFCPKASCVSQRNTAAADVLLDLENANKEYLDSLCHHGEAARKDVSGNLDSTRVHTTDPRGPERAARLRRLQLPVLCMHRPGESIWEPVQLFTGDTKPQNPPKQGPPTQRYTTMRLVPEELGRLASCNGLMAAAPTLPDIRCCACGGTYELGEVVRVVELMRKLEESAQRLSQACCKEDSEAIQLEGREVLKLFSAVRAYAHPGNLSLLSIAESLNRSCRGLAALYNGVGLTISQHLSRAAAALHGRCSTQHADHLVTEGSLLHFLSQADTEEEAVQAWSLWTEGDSSMEATGGAAGSAAGGNTFEYEICSETRAKLALQARECLLQACSIFFSYEGCSTERQKGRVAEGRIADCERELQALGFPS